MTGGNGYIAGGLAFTLTAFLAFAAGVYATEEPAKTSPVDAPKPIALPGDPALISKLRGLSELQQRVVDGDRSALTEQLAVARMIAKDVGRKPPSVWGSARDRRSLIKYTLSGGDPSVLGRLSDTSSLPEAERALARGVVAYSRGDRTQAANLLGSVNHRSLEPSLAGHVALVKAVLASQTAAGDALRLCHDAIFLSPGTHIEEAALRLWISIAIATGDAAAVQRAHSRHLTRFPNSLYAGEIDARVAGVIVSNPGGDAAQLSATEALSKLVPPPRRRAFFAQLAEAGLRAGQLKIAARAARLALLAQQASPALDAQAFSRLLAIEGAALVLGSNRKDGIRRLEEARAAASGGETADLIAAAQSLVGLIESPPARTVVASSRATTAAEARPSVPAATAHAPTGVRTATSDKPHHEAVLSRGREILAAADELIELAKK